MITVFTLNGVVRPLMAKWHKAVTDGRLKNEDVRHQLREELIELQSVLRKLCPALAAMAEGDAFVPGSESWPSERPVGYQLGGSIPFQILFDRAGGATGNSLTSPHNEIRQRRGLPELNSQTGSPKQAIETAAPKRFCVGGRKGYKGDQQRSSGKHLCAIVPV